MPEDTFQPDFDLLVSACREGDQRAWSRLVSELSPLVYSIPIRSGFSRDEAEDVVQTVFALLVRKLDTIEDPQALPKWLSVTTQRACWREIRSGRARLARESEVASSKPYDQVEAESETQSHAETLRLALAAIGSRCERLIRALFGSGSEDRPSYDKVAEAAEMPIGSIGPTRARCLQRLTKSLEEEPEGRELLARFGSAIPRK